MSQSSHGRASSPEHASNVRQLESVRAALSRSDAIIDPNIIKSLRLFPSISIKVDRGSNRQEQLKKYLGEGQALLSRSYCGYTKSCNLLLDWMKNIQDSKTINNAFVSSLKSAAVEMNEEKLADMKQNKSKTKNEMDVDGDPIDMDDYKQQIYAEIDAIAQSFGDTTVQQRGFGLHEFQDKFTNHLVKILQSTQRADYEKRCQRLIVYCCKNELYYLYGRRFLSVLRQQNVSTEIDYAVAHIESALDEYTNSIFLGQAVDQVQNVNLTNCTRILELNIFAKGVEFQNDLRVPSIELMRKGSFTKADIAKVYQYYHSRYTQNQSIKLRFLQNTQIINYLYDTLFIPQQTQNLTNKHYLSQYIFLLNYALCEPEENAENGENGEAALAKHKQQFDANMKMLTNVTEICRDNSFAVTLSQNAEKQNILFEGIQHAGIARGVLIWINYCMYVKCDVYLNENFETYLTPLLVSIIAQIARVHIFLRPAVAQFAYNMIYNIGDQTTSTLSTKSAVSFSAKDTAAESMKNLEVIQTMLDIMVFIIQLGEYQLVFEIINKRPNDLIKLDRSLHRHFITRIISTCLPPLPNQFVVSLFKLLKDDHILAAIRNDQTTSDIVIKFVEKHESVAPTDAKTILSQINNQQRLFK